MRKVKRWAILWRANSKLDGHQEYFMWNLECPYLFMTRREARKWIEDNYAYIRTRRDLKAEPHGWKMPKAMQVNVILEPIYPERERAKKLWMAAAEASTAASIQSVKDENDRRTV